MWVQTIMPCLNASMFSSHQQFLFLLSLLCFLDANIAFEFQYRCYSSTLLFLYCCCSLSPTKPTDVPRPPLQKNGKMIPSSTKVRITIKSPTFNNQQAQFMPKGKSVEAYQTFISIWFTLLNLSEASI